MKTLFEVVVVDPPWSYGKQKKARTSRYKTQQAREHYDVIGNKGDGEINRNTGDGIQSIIDATPIAEWAAADAHLYLWTTNPKLPFAFEVMRAWGFTYKTTLTWVKTRLDGGVVQGGMGWFYRGATEHVLFGVRGNKPIPTALRRPNVILAPRSGHSAKPDEFYALVDAVTPTGPRVDVYARKPRNGWSIWGKGVSTLGYPVESPSLSANAGKE